MCLVGNEPLEGLSAIGQFGKQFPACLQVEEHDAACLLVYGKSEAVCLQDIVFPVFLYIPCLGTGKHFLLHHQAAFLLGYLPFGRCLHTYYLVCNSRQSNGLRLSGVCLWQSYCEAAVVLSRICSYCRKKEYG